MLVVKGGIRREIDETKLNAYREKGYVPLRQGAPDKDMAQPVPTCKPGKKA